MKPHTEMIEGPEAWDRFKSAMKAIVTGGSLGIQIAIPG